MRAIVYTDGAAVYSAPNFDAPVQDYLSYETKVVVSKNAKVGEGGLGLFHVIKYGSGKQGYITDTDIRIVRKSGAKKNDEADEEDDEDPTKKPVSMSKAWEKEEQEAMGNAPMYFRRYLGGTLAMVNFTEKFSGRKLSDQMMLYGLHMSGPGTLFDGPPLDFNFWFSLSQPDYLKQFSAGTPTGFMLFGDVGFQLPFYDGKSTLVTYGPGLMALYTNYKIPVKSPSAGKARTFDSQEMRIGVDVSVAVSQKITKKLLVRGDLKYFYEKAGYLGYGLSIQGEY